MKIVIDGQEIEGKEDATVLDTALAAGVYIPHLCSHPDLEALGGCRLCSVENESTGEVVPSCMTIIEDGMRFLVNSPKANKVRKLSMELILATHPADCTGCPKYGKCELQSMYQYMGVGPERWRKKTRSTPNDDTNPLISHSFTRCVRCGRCIRACGDLRGVKVLDYQNTKDGIRAGIEPGKSLKEAGCKFCGACIEVCPTGSIMDSIGIIKDNVSYSDSVVPCRAGCPAGINIPLYIRYIKEGDFSSATAVVREKVPFPDTLGRICNHECEQSCKRNEIDSPVSICKLKRAAAENTQVDKTWTESLFKLQPTGKKVAVIGSGPAGLTAAYFLARKGHEVIIHEKYEKAGGQCRYGIPSYRLPDCVLDHEINLILETGVQLITNSNLENPVKLLSQGFDSVLVATGTHSGNEIAIDGNTLNGVMLNTDFLRDTRTGNISSIGKRVMVLGGGNVAFDCARTALRLGAKEVHLACLESIETMTAEKQEIEEGLEEGIILHNSTSFMSINGTHNVESITLNKIENFYFDENGQLAVNLIENSQEIIEIDNIIFAVGQKPEGTKKMGLELVKLFYIKIDTNNQTNISGIYAAGDVTTGTKTVIQAIESGRKSAQSIDLYLGGDGCIDLEASYLKNNNPYIGRDENFAYIKRHKSGLLDVASRIVQFSEVEKVLKNSDAMEESKRCLQCDLRLELSKPKLWNDYK